jgi:prepilin-type N-terminal cleavage/methylation domain-containing protein
MQAKHPRGFSLVELMVVTTVIGILALLAVPGVLAAAQRAEATAAANDIRVFTNAIEFYSTAEGGYPPQMTYREMPESIEGYLPGTWKDGTYNWFYVNTSDYIYLYVYNLGFTPEQAVRIDSIIDDGNIGSGRIRMAFNGSGLMHIFESKR